MSDGLPSTILYPDAFNRSLPAGWDGPYHWEFWRPAIGRRNISPCDIDAVVEINNFLLMAETKDPGLPVVDDDGQGRTRCALINSGLVTFIYQWGKETPVAWQAHGFGWKTPVYTTVSDGPTMKHDIARFIRRWADHHDAKDMHEWRRQAIRAALKDAPPEILHFAQIAIGTQLPIVPRPRARPRLILPDLFGSGS